MKKKRIVAAQRKLAAQVVAAAKSLVGFTVEVMEKAMLTAGSPVECWPTTREDSYDDRIAVIIRSETRCLIFDIFMQESYRAGRKVSPAATINGHTVFKHNDRWVNFDRLGVSDSFYWSSEDKDQTVAEVLAAELKRCDDYIARDANRITVPVIGYRITPARKAEHIAALKAGKLIRFTPSGFGTGYVYAAKPTARRWGQPADDKLKAFFECETLVYETIDCD